MNNSGVKILLIWLNPIKTRVQRSMGRGPDVTSNPEHDDSVARIFTCFGKKDRGSISKNRQPGAL